MSQERDVLPKELMEYCTQSMRYTPVGLTVIFEKEVANVLTLIRWLRLFIKIYQMLGQNRFAAAGIRRNP